MKTIATLATELNVTTEDLQALIEGGQVDQDELFASETGAELSETGIEILTDAVKALS